MSDLFNSILSDESRKSSSLSSPILTNSSPEPEPRRNSKRQCVKQILFRCIYWFEVWLHLALYSTLGSTVFLITVIAGMVIAATSTIWIPSLIVCLPLLLIAGLIWQYTSLSTRFSIPAEIFTDEKRFWLHLFDVAKW